MHKVLNILIFCFILFSGTAQNYLYVDSLYEYKVQVPKWLTINENVENHVFGGIFHSTDHTENSIYIHGFEKKKYKTFNDFKFTFIEGNVSGKESLFDLNFVSKGKNLAKNIENGVRCKLMFERNNNEHHYEFILLETSNNYLWIYFEATPETYPENLDKFDDWMKGFTILEIK